MTGWPRQGRAALFLFLVLGHTSLENDPAASAQGVITESRTRLISGGFQQKPFDVTLHTIPLHEITSGEVPRDGIPALVHPQFVSAKEAGRRLKGSDRVLGVFFFGEAKAYPVRILNWHELVNDTVGGRPMLVSW